MQELLDNYNPINPALELVEAGKQLYKLVRNRLPEPTIMLAEFAVRM